MRENLLSCELASVQYKYTKAVILCDTGGFREDNLGRYDFGFFWNFNTGKQILTCVTETQRYGHIRDSEG